MISLANQSQTEQGWFYLNFDGHLASFLHPCKSAKNQIHFFYTKLLSFIYKLSTIMRILERKMFQVLPGIWLVCYGAALNYLNMYNGINLNYD